MVILFCMFLQLCQPISSSSPSLARLEFMELNESGNFQQCGLKVVAETVRCKESVADCVRSPHAFELLNL